jgi:hypothetical protein
MIKRFAVGAGVLLAVAVLSGQVHAQAMGYGGGMRGHGVGRPTVSPYLNLIASDVLSQSVGTAGGYQTLVKPFVDGRKAINANSAAISQMAAQSAYGGYGASAASKGAGFMNYSHYYPAMGGRGNARCSGRNAAEPPAIAWAGLSPWRCASSVGRRRWTAWSDRRTDRPLPPT